MSRESQLSASHTGIHSFPRIITHCAPPTVQTNFHTSFIWLITSRQPDTSISASYNELKCIKSFHQAMGILLPHSQTPTLCLLYFLQVKSCETTPKHWEENSGLEHSRGQGDLLRRPCHPDYTHRECLILAYYYTDRVHLRLTLHTSHTSIIKVASAAIISPDSPTKIPWTINESCLRPSAE